MIHNPDVALGVLRDAGHKALRLSVALRESVCNVQSENRHIFKRSTSNRIKEIQRIAIVCK